MMGMYACNVLRRQRHGRFFRTKRIKQMETVEVSCGVTLCQVGGSFWFPFRFQLIFLYAV
jgi:hypothetical protein